MANQDRSSHDTQHMACGAAGTGQQLNVARGWGWLPAKASKLGVCKHMCCALQVLDSGLHQGRICPPSPWRGPPPGGTILQVWPGGSWVVAAWECSSKPFACLSAAECSSS